MVKVPRRVATRLLAKLVEPPSTVRTPRILCTLVSSSLSIIWLLGSIVKASLRFLKVETPRELIRLPPPQAMVTVLHVKFRQSFPVAGMVNITTLGPLGIIEPVMTGRRLRTSRDSTCFRLRQFRLLLSATQELLCEIKKKLANRHLLPVRVRKV